MPNQNPFEFNSGFRDILSEVSARKLRFERKLGLLPYREEEFTAEEIQQIIEVKQKLNTLIQLFNQETRGVTLGSERYKQICGKYLQKTLELLDAASYWSYKFSTEAGGAAEGRMGNSPDDSIYYITPRNISLRIKRANINRGLAAVIQPFFEKVLFEKSDGGYMVSTPELGYTVIEYSSHQFLDLQRKETHIPKEDFHSPLRMYHENDQIVAVRTIKEGETLEHRGDRINAIFK